MRLDRIRLAEGEISYVKQGKGPRMLFLHGAIATVQAYGPLVDLLTHDYQIVAPVHPGHGTSFALPHWWKLHDYVLFYQDFLKEIEFKPDVLIGHSFGGMLALLLASEGVGARAVAMDCPGLPFRFEVQEYIRMVALEGRETLKKRPDLKRLKDPSAPAASIAQTVAFHPKDISVFSRFAPKYNIASQVKKISIPVELLWGQEDRVVPLEMGRKLQALIPNSRLTVLPGMGHNYSVIYPEFTYTQLLRVMPANS